MNAPSRWFGYGRASRADQVLSPEVQHDQIRQYVKFKSLQRDTPCVWRGWFCDKATSSKIAFARRPEAEKLLQLVEPGDNIVISKLDRGFRSTHDACSTLMDLDNRGISLHLLDLNLDMSTPEGRLMFRTMASMAEYERDRIIMRTKEAQQGLRDRRLPCGTAPRGYLYKGKGDYKRIAPDPDYRRSVYELLKLHEVHGLTFKQLEAHCAQNGITDPRSQTNKRRWDRARMCQAFQAARSGWPVRGTPGVPCSVDYEYGNGEHDWWGDRFPCKAELKFARISN